MGYVLLDVCSVSARFGSNAKLRFVDFVGEAVALVKFAIHVHCCI
jgi:hypothetical protein